MVFFYFSHQLTNVVILNENCRHLQKKFGSFATYNFFDKLKKSQPVRASNPGTFMPQLGHCDLSSSCFRINLLVFQSDDLKLVLFLFFLLNFNYFWNSKTFFDESVLLSASVFSLIFSVFMTI